MRRDTYWRLAGLTILSATFLLAAARTQAQSATEPSVADAARRARDLKKKSEKPVRVVTEDMLNPASAAPVGQSVPTNIPSDASTPPLAAGDTSAEAPADGAPVKNSAETDALLQEIAEKQKELDLAQGELALQQDTYFSNPDHATDTAGKAKTDAMQVQVTEKQQQLDELKTRLAASKELQGRTPKPAAPAPAPAPPPEPAVQAPAPARAPAPPLPPGES